MSRSAPRMPVAVVDEFTFDLFRLVAAFCLLMGTLPRFVFGIGPITTVRAQSDTNSDGKKIAVASCPPGTVAFSGGGGVGSPSGLRNDLAVLYNMSTGDPPTEWTVMAQEMTATDDIWEVEAYAYCAEIPGYKRASAGSAFTSDNYKSIDVSCPSGTTMIGGGSSIIAAPSQVIKLTHNHPLENGWSASASEFTSTSGAWLLGVTVGCAPAMDLDLEVISAILGTEFEHGQRVDLYCSPHRIAIGGGWKFFGDISVQGLLRSRASPLFHEVWEVHSGSLSAGPNRHLGVYAICFSSEIFSHGFESGDTEAWSNTVP